MESFILILETNIAAIRKIAAKQRERGGKGSSKRAAIVGSA